MKLEKNCSCGYYKDLVERKDNIIKEQTGVISDLMGLIDSKDERISLLKDDLELQRDLLDEAEETIRYYENALYEAEQKCDNVHVIEQGDLVEYDGKVWYYQGKTPEKIRLVKHTGTTFISFEEGQKLKKVNK